MSFSASILVLCWNQIFPEERKGSRVVLGLRCILRMNSLSNSSPGKAIHCPGEIGCQVRSLSGWVSSSVAHCSGILMTCVNKISLEPQCWKWRSTESSGQKVTRSPLPTRRGTDPHNIPFHTRGKWPCTLTILTVSTHTQLACRFPGRPGEILSVLSRELRFSTSQEILALEPS